MSDRFIKKTLQLSLEFDTYIIKRPRQFAKIPNKATVFFTVAGDEPYNRSSRELMERTRGKKEKIVEARKVGRIWKIEPVSIQN